MIKFLKLNEYIIFIILSIILGLFINILEVNQSINTNSILELYINSYGLLNIENIKDNIIYLVKWLIIHIFLIMNLYDCISKYFLTYGTLIFTRTDKRIKFLKLKFLLLFQLVLTFYCIQFLTTLLIGKINGLILNDLFSIFKAILVFTLYQSLILLIINLLCIYFNSRVVVTMILLIQIIPLFLIEFLMKLNIALGKWVLLIPTINSLIVTNLSKKDIILNLQQKYSYIYSLTYLSILILTSFIMGCLFINKIDLLEDNE